MGTNAFYFKDTKQISIWDKEKYYHKYFLECIPEYISNSIAFKIYNSPY